MKLRILLIAALYCIITITPSLAAPIRVYVSDINAVGVQNRDELKITLQTLLASRLNGDKIMSVTSAAEAEVLVSGTYVVIGKIFSVDAIAKTAKGASLARAFVQGEGQDELIPSVGKLAEKLNAELTKVYVAEAASSASLSVPASVHRQKPDSDIIRNDSQVKQVAASEFIKTSDFERGSRGGWVSRRLDGAANLLASGRTMADGIREIFLAEDRRLSYYHQSGEMKLISEIELRPSEKIISVDPVVTADNQLEIYLTVIRSDELASQVWQIKENKFVQLADNLPYFFRYFGLAGGQKKLYAQSMGPGADFFGPVYEANRTGSTISTKNPIKMPRFGDIYTFNQFRDRDGNVLVLAINPDNYLVVYTQDLQELWRSNDKFGGSELFFQKEDANPAVTGSRYRSIFLNQRIQVTSKGEVLVGKNDGFWVLGDARSYKKGAVYNLVWNGSSLEEKWRTKDTQNYMPDYAYDESRNELLILQTVQRPGITSGRGASSLSIKKVE